MLLGLAAVVAIGIACALLSDDITVGWENLPSLADAAPQQHWEDNAKPADVTVNSRELRLTFKDDTVEGEYLVRAPVTSGLVQTFLSAKNMASDDTMANTLLGGVTVSDRPAIDVALSPWPGTLNFHAARADIGGGTATLVWRSDPLRLYFGRRSVEIGPEARAVVTGDDTVTLNGWAKLSEPRGLTLVSSSGQTASLRRAAKGAGFSSEDAAVGYLDVPRWLGGEPVPFVDAPLQAIGILVFALLALVASAKAGTADVSLDDEARLRRTIRLQVALVVIWAGSTAAFGLPSGSDDPDIFPWAVVLLLVVPPFLIPSFASEPARQRRRRDSIGVAVALISLAVLAAAINGSGLGERLVGGFSQDPSALVFAAAGLLGAAVVAGWGIRVRRPVLVGVLVGACGLAAVYWWPRLFYIQTPEGRYSAVGRWTYVGACAALAVGLAIWVYRFVVDIWPGGLRTGGRVVVAGCCAVAMSVIIVPSGVLVANVLRPARGVVTVPDLAPVLQSVVSLLDWALLAALAVLVLRRMEAGRPFAEVRPLMIVIFTLMVYWVDRFMYVPVTALLGALAAHVLLRPAAEVDPQPAAGDDMLETEDVASPGRMATLRGMVGRLPHRRPAQADVGAPEEPAPDKPLPAPSSRLVYGVVVGLVVGLPLNVAFVLSGNTTWRTGEFLLLDFVDSPLWSLSFWAMCGGFVALCWPFLRGDGALSKALWLWVAMNVADLPMAVVWNNWGDWLTRGVNAVETLAFLLVLCLVLDVRMSVSARSTIGQAWQVRRSRWFASGALLAVVLSGVATTYANSLASELGKTTVDTVLPHKNPSSGSNQDSP